jgi:4-diphosphocytidyl-2-C-methyl-D-erythritol kinase
MHNVLEIVTAGNHKIVNILKNVMIDNGALGAIMSGSGPSVFGIYNKLEYANKSRDALKQLVNEVFVCQQKKNHLI